MKYCLLGHTNSIIYLLKFTIIMCTYADHIGPHLQSTENELLFLSKKDFSPYLIQYSHTHTHTHTHIHTHSCPSNSFIISIMCTYSYFINLYTYFIPRIRSLYSTFLTHQWFINLHFTNFHFINLYILYISNSFTILLTHQWFINFHFTNL